MKVRSLMRILALGALVAPGLLAEAPKSNHFYVTVHGKACALWSISLQPEGASLLAVDAGRNRLVGGLFQPYTSRVTLEDGVRYRLMFPGTGIWTGSRMIMQLQYKLAFTAADQSSQFTCTAMLDVGRQQLLVTEPRWTGRAGATTGTGVPAPSGSDVLSLTFK